MRREEVEAVIRALKSDKDYPLFLSERHLQTAFALKARELYDEYKLYPEYVFDDIYHDEKFHIDLVVADDDNELTAFEFKYIQAGGEIKVPGDDHYKLRRHGARGIRMHQCMSDIERLEMYVALPGAIKKGYFVLITNDKALWTDSIEEGTTYKPFQLRDGGVIGPGEVRAIGDTEFARTRSMILLRNEYKIEYEGYGKDNTGKEFKYLIVEVN